MTTPHVLAIVLAGGAGSRLRPLTEDRAKPAVPFGGHFRLIDFALSNIVNSGYLRVVVLTQYKSHSLDRHITKTWRMSTLLGNYVAPVPAQQRRGEHWYQGSADAIYQSLNTIEDEKPDYVVIVGADNIYRMDFSQMLDYHIESGLPCTVAGIRQPVELSSSFGVIKSTDGKVDEFVEKPATTEGLPDDPNSFLASMGNYIFTTDALVKALREDAQNEDSNHDMGGDLVPWFVKNGGCGVYDFIDNVVPGSTERDANPDSGSPTARQVRLRRYEHPHGSRDRFVRIPRRNRLRWRGHSLHPLPRRVRSLMGTRPRLRRNGWLSHWPKRSRVKGNPRQERHCRRGRRSRN